MDNQTNTGTTSQYRNSRGRLDTYSLAEQLMEDYHVIRIQSDNKLRQNMLYLYNNGIYEHDMQKLEGAIRKLGRGAKPAEIKNTLNDLFSMAPIKEESSYEYIAFNNCIVNIKTLETFDFDYDKFVITSKVYADYDVAVLTTDTSSVKLVNKFFSDITCGDIELQICLLEIVLYCMLRTAKHHRSFILKGNAHNGKSDYMHIINSLLGKFCTHQDLTQLSNLNNLKKIYQRTANIIDDVKEIARVDFGKLHSIISGGNIAIKGTGEEEFAFAPYSTLIFGTTNNLDFSGCNDDTLRRFKVIPFNTKFDSTTVDRNMTENITAPASLSVIATKAIQTASKLLGREWEFPAVVEQQTNIYFFEGNPVLAFGKTHPIKRIISIDNYYREYCLWYLHTFNTECDINIAVFGKRLSALLNIKSIPHTIDGNKDTYYQASDFNFENFRQQHQDYCQSLDSSKSPMSLLEYAKYLDKLDKEQEQSVVTDD